MTQNKKEWQHPTLEVLNIKMTEAGPLKVGKPDWTQDGGGDEDGLS